MIKIIINGSAIELLPDTSIVLHFQSPVFYDEGTYSLPIKITNSINNRRILNFPARVENLSNQPLSYECEIQANSFHLKGFLIVNSVSVNKIEAYYTDGIGHFNYLCEGKYLTDIEDTDPPSFTTLDEMFTYLFDTVNYNYPTRKIVCFPSSNMALFDKTNHETGWRDQGGMINNYDYANEEFFFYLNEYNIPHFYLNYIIDKIFDTFGFHLGYSLFETNVELRQLVIMSDFFKNITSINMQTHLPSDLRFHPAWYLPKYLIKTFIDDLRSMFFCEFLVNNRSKTVDIKFLKDILESITYRNISDKADKNYEIDFDEIEDGYEFGFDLDSSDETMSAVNEIDNFVRGDDVETIGDLPDYSGAPQHHENEIRLVRDENKFYYFYHSLSGPTTWLWGYFSDNFSHKLYGKGELQKISSSLPPRMIEKTWLIPQCEVQAFDLDDHPFKDQGGYYTQLLQNIIALNKPRLVFWHGLLPGLPNYPNNDLFPFASPDFYYKDLFHVYNKIPGKTISLFMTGDGNLYDKFGARFTYWWFNVKKLTKWRINWTTIDLHELDFSIKYRIRNQNYLIKSVEATINADGNLEIGDTELVLT